MDLVSNKQIMIVDCQLAGISGDMIVAALLDLGADSKKVLAAMRSAKEHLEGCDDIDIIVTETSRSGFRAKQVTIKAHESVKHRSGFEIVEAVNNLAKALNLQQSAQDFAERSIRALVETEAKLHGKNIDKVDLHEAGSVDTVADIIGTATALDDLGILKGTKIYSTPVAVGGGLFRFSHGTVASPAPATLEILAAKRFAIVGGLLDRELSTPTGAAILTNLAEKSLDHLPPMRPERIGYGAGENEFDTFPNILRIITGTASQAGHLEDGVVLLETNLDDITGEVVGYTMERLLSAGAKDVSVTPIFEKKSRPAWIISVVAEEKDAATLTDVLTSETGTLGVRVHPCHRRVLQRESRKVEFELKGTKAEISIKIARDRSGRIINLKPEYDDIRDLALRLGLPFRTVHEEATKQASKRLELG
jgi:uncharacterized protein (TIGR00299 family) protein